MEWQEEIIRRLLDAGYMGITQNELCKGTVANYADLTEIHPFLESLRAQEAVQRFTVPWGYYWRATDRLLSVV